MPFESFTEEQRRQVLRAISAVINSKYPTDRRIFFLHNSLWGLARMGATKKSIDSLLERSENEETLSSQLLNNTIDILHTFLPEQLGDVMWALGTMKYSLHDMGPERADRVVGQTVLSITKLNFNNLLFVIFNNSWQFSVECMSIYLVEAGRPPCGP